MTKLLLCPLSGVTFDDFLESPVLEVNVEGSSWDPRALEVNSEESSWVPVITITCFIKVSTFKPMSASITLVFLIFLLVLGHHLHQSVCLLLIFPGHYYLGP